MSKFQLLKNLLEESGPRGTVFVPETSQYIYVLACVMADAYAAGAITYRATMGDTLMDELIAQIRVHNDHLASKLANEVHSYGGRFNQPANAIGHGALI